MLFEILSGWMCNSLLSKIISHEVIVMLKKCGSVFRGVMMLVVMILASAYLMSGCAHKSSYTLEPSNNILTKSIQFELPAADLNIKTKSYEEYLAVVTKGLESYMNDTYGRKRVELMAKELYPEYAKVESEIFSKSKNKSNLDKVMEALTHSFMTRHNGQIDSLGDLQELGFGNRLEKIYYATNTTLLNGQHGTGVYKISLYSKEQGDQYTPAIDVFIGVSYQVKNDKIFVDVNHVSYNTNRLQVKKDLLIRMISGASLYEIGTPNAYYFRSKITDQLAYRYSSRTAEADKQERVYKVDFSTAKARLQRALGNSVYNNEKTAFIIEESYSNPSPRGYGSVKHKHIISLFPERNNTLVEFSGNYGYYADTYGGESKYGKDEFNAARARLVLIVDQALRK